MTTQRSAATNQRPILVLLAAMGLVACSKDSAKPTAETSAAPAEKAGEAAQAVPAGEAQAVPAEVARARAALMPFKKTLRATLMAALERGPEEAIAVCAEAAPRLAAENAPAGVTLGRTAARLRNQSNRPAGWRADALAALASAKPDGGAYYLAPLPGGGTAYAEPIFIEPLCETCHGASVAPPIIARLDALYPADQARGFATGDLRGLFWVELPPVTGASESR